MIGTYRAIKKLFSFNEYKTIKILVKFFIHFETDYSRNETNKTKKVDIRISALLRRSKFLSWKINEEHSWL